jgi:hypothetical protein
MLTFVADTAALNRSLTRLAVASKVALGDVLKQETAYLVREILRFTPPKSRKQGEGAIYGDLFGGKKSSATRYSSIGLFQKIGSSTQLPPRKTGGEGETIGVNLGWERGKKVRIMRKFWKPGASLGEMREFHKRYQNPKTGRTGRISQSTIGRWKVQDQMWVGDAQAKAYFNELKKRVGWTLAGWQTLAQQCGADKLGGSKRWSARLATAAGASNTNFSGNGRPYVHATAFNVKIPNYQRMVDGAVASRLRTTDKKLEQVLKGKAVNLGFTRVGPSSK